MSVIECTTFRPRADVTEAALMAADASVQTGFAYLQPGLVRRTTARSTDGEWLVVTIWESDDAADAAQRASTTADVVAEFAALLEPGTVTTRRFATLPG